MSAPRPEGMTDEEFRPWLVRQIQACGPRRMTW